MQYALRTVTCRPGVLATRRLDGYEVVRVLRHHARAFGPCECGCWRAGQYGAIPSDLWLASMLSMMLDAKRGEILLDASEGWAAEKST